MGDRGRRLPAGEDSGRTRSLDDQTGIHNDTRGGGSESQTSTIRLWYALFRPDPALIPYSRCTQLSFHFCSLSSPAPHAPHDEGRRLRLGWR